MQPANAALFASSPGTPQRFTFGYNLTFSSTTAFPAGPGESSTVAIEATVTATVAGQPVTVTGTGQITLTTDAAPFFAGGSATSWLSADLRVFQAEPGTWTLPALPGQSGPTATGVTLYDTGDPTKDATTFIQAVITAFNESTAAPPDHPFDAISTGENASSLDTLPTDPATSQPVYNFAVARVRYTTTAESARAARVFFRLIPALSVSTSYDDQTTYRRWSDGVEFGETIPLLGIDPSSDDVVTIPCFATPRVDAASVSLTTQTDDPNVQTIVPPTGGATESYAYYGCWLDLNQQAVAYPATVTAANLDGPFPAGSLQSVQTLLRNQHQCLVAEIAFDPDPTEEGFAPAFTGPLAQRNLSLVPAANPGELGSRRVSNTFVLTPPAAGREGPAPADTLMIDWGDLPAGSTASLYWPTVDAEAVYDLAAASYANGARGLEILDPHTLQTPVGGIGYIPVPPGTDAQPAGARIGSAPVRDPGRPDVHGQLPAADVGGDRRRPRRGGRRIARAADRRRLPAHDPGPHEADDAGARGAVAGGRPLDRRARPRPAARGRRCSRATSRRSPTAWPGSGGDPAQIAPSPTGGLNGHRHHRPEPVRGFLRLSAEEHGEPFELFGEFDGFLRRR